MRNTWAHKDVIIRERISFRTLSATHASHGRVRDLNACGGSNQQAEKHRRSQQHRQRADKHRCCLTAQQICSFAHVDCVLHGFSNFASFSLRFSLLLLLTFWRHDRHHRRSLLLNQLLRPEIAPAAPAHLPFITSICHFDCIRTTASTRTHLH